MIRSETDEALALTGKDVGTPIIQFQPPDGMAFFGPVISRLPAPDDAVRLWDHVAGLVTFPGFAELKRSLRERPQLRAFGFDPRPDGRSGDWLRPGGQGIGAAAIRQSTGGPHQHDHGQRHDPGRPDGGPPWPCLRS